MAQNITLMGASYPDVPAVTLPKTGGGTATFTDVSDTTATASDVLSGKYFYDASGVRTQGTGTGGGGGGLVYEIGTYTPANDVARPTINFANSHNNLPVFIMLEDATGTYDNTLNSNHLFFFCNYYGLTGEPVYVSSTSLRYAIVRYEYRGTSTTSLSGAGANISNPPDVTGTPVTYYNQWVTSSGFMPYTNSGSRYWRAGRTYKWIAAWAPTS